MINKNKSTGLDVLLLLDGEIFPMGNGYWTKFEVKIVVPDDHMPHGIKYSLTLHNRHNRRIIGYDNAHGFKPKRKKFGAKRIVWDHKHNQNITSPYEFESPVQLLEDFWKSVNEILS